MSAIIPIVPIKVQTALEGDGMGCHSGGDTLLAAAKSVEADLVDRMGEMESAALRNLLKQAILATDPGLPKLWQATALQKQPKISKIVQTVSHSVNYERVGRSESSPMATACLRPNSSSMINVPSA